MTITRAAASWPGRWRAPRPALPAPSPDEVAAVAARLAARRQPLPRGGRRRAVVSTVVGVVLLVLAALLFLDATAEGDYLRWGVLLVGVVLVLVARQRVAHCRDVDDAVRRRLAVAGPGRAAPPERPPWGRADVVAGVVTVVVVAGELVGVVAWAATRGPGTVAFAAAVLLLMAAGSATVRRAARSAPVGGGAILTAVDSALRRRDVLAATTPLWWVAFFAVSRTRAGDGWLALQLLGFVVMLVSLCVAAYVRDDSWLLRDQRLSTTTPPSVWLAGA